MADSLSDILPLWLVMCYGAHRMQADFKLVQICRFESFDYVWMTSFEWYPNSNKLLHCNAIKTLLFSISWDLLKPYIVLHTFLQLFSLVLKLLMTLISIRPCIDILLLCYTIDQKNTQVVENVIFKLAIDMTVGIPYIVSVTHDFKWEQHSMIP